MLNVTYDVEKPQAALINNTILYNCMVMVASAAKHLVRHYLH